MSAPFKCRTCGRDTLTDRGTCNRIECSVTLAAMPRGGKRPGAGRPRSIAGDETRILNLRLGVPVHTDELAALVVEGKGANESEALRWLIEQSAKRRARKR